MIQQARLLAATAKRQAEWRKRLGAQDMPHDTNNPRGEPRSGVGGGVGVLGGWCGGVLLVHL
jgi:hypothetical protein